ncbi:ABC transporter permease subunit [Alkalicoccus chagannorensis]|uniref:ABC transporter permease subunit n=1 Tax=Alkalicoccus chagannorensis TaxID=427072 RepID=UPI00047CF180|nr:ABC transporter permease subunit [Alkalicoccus chagannorensis]
MMHKGLLQQNWKQIKLVVWILLVIFVLHMPLQAALSIETWNERVEQAEQSEEYVYEVQAWEVQQIFSEGLFSFFAAFTIAFLAAVLIGLERNTRRNDFTFSLPFSRKQLFLSKWLLGSGTIALFFLINFFPAYWIISQSEFSYALTTVTWIEIFWGPLFGYVFFFTFCLFVGTMTGEMISQMILSFILAFLPQIMLILIQELMRVHDLLYYLVSSHPRWVDYLTPFYYAIGELGEIAGLLLSILFTAAALFGGIVLYEHNKLEYNGEFLIFKSLTVPFLVMITVIISLFGGLVVSSLAPWGADALRIISYWIGFCTFLLFAVLILKRITAMNVKFSGKAI